MSKVEQSVITVGIGASAGGLEAFKVLFECLSVDTGLVFCYCPAFSDWSRKHADRYSLKIYKNARPNCQRWHSR